MFDRIGAALYRLVAPLLVFALRIFFRRLEVRGLDHVPDAPVIVGANHPNMLLDPLLVGMALLPRRLHFLAKAPLFDIPVVGTLFRLLGVLPVYRRQDGPGDTSKNQGMFSACVAALHGGRSIGIFPEGVSASEPWLQPIKTGASRILLEAQDAAPDQPMYLLPVGLNYTDRQTFRSDVLVLFGAPLDPRRYLDAYRRDPRDAVRAMTADLEAALKALTTNLARVEDERVVDRLERVYQTELLPVGDDLAERFYLSRAIVDGYEYFSARDPARVARVEADLHEYFFALDVLGLSRAHLRDDTGYRASNVLLFLFQTVPPLVLTAPVALWGTVMNFLPYNLTDPLARRGDPGPEELATNKAVVGSLLFAGFYLAQTAAAAAVGGPLAALGYLASLPVSGLLALWWIERARTLLRHWRTFWLFLSRRGLRARLVELRARLVADLAALSEEFLRRREAAGEGEA